MFFFGLASKPVLSDLIYSNFDESKTSASRRVFILPVLLLTPLTENCFCYA